MKKIQGQERSWVSAPPTMRPTALPPMAIAAQTPSAFARSAPSWKVVVMIASAAGEMNAASEPLKGTRSDQHPRAAGEPVEKRGGREHNKAEEEEPLAAEQVARAPPEQEEPAEDEGVRVHDPLEVRLRQTQVFLNRGQSDVYYRASSTTMNWAKQTRTRISQGFVPWRVIGLLQRVD